MKQGGIGRGLVVAAIVLGAAAPALGLEHVTRRPPPGRVVVTSTQIDVLGPLWFARGTTALARDGAAMLDALARTLDGNPSLRRIELRAYADPGRPDGVLAAGRAEAIRAALVARGVAAVRLRAVGVAAAPPGHRGHVDVVIAERAP